MRAALGLALLWALSLPSLADGNYNGEAEGPLASGRAVPGGLLFSLEAQAQPQLWQLQLLNEELSRQTAHLASLTLPPGYASTALATVRAANAALQSAVNAAVSLASSADAVETAAAVEAVRARYEEWRSASANPAFVAVVPPQGADAGADSAAQAAAIVQERFQALRRVFGGAGQPPQEAEDASGALKTPEEMQDAWSQLTPDLAKRLSADYARAYREAYFDSLTALGSRKYLDHHVPQLAADAHYQLMGDVDHFKSVNDDAVSGGHLVGDSALRTVARIWGAELANAGEVGVRWGGEEFWGRVRGGKETALAVAARINERVRAEVGPAVGLKRLITISIGISRYEPDATRETKANFLGAMKAADDALYFAKNNGRDQVVFEEKGKFAVTTRGAAALPPAPALQAPASASFWARCRAWLSNWLG